jgi:hypothetical protein
LTKRFKFSTDYYEEVAFSTSDHLDWSSLRLIKSQETSNDVTFANVKHTLILELTGTSKHLSVLDGKTYENVTEKGDICQIPLGLSSRFAWQTRGDTQNSIIVEFDSRIFCDHCPELIYGNFLSGHLLPVQLLHASRIILFDPAFGSRA